MQPRSSEIPIASATGTVTIGNSSNSTHSLTITGGTNTFSGTIYVSYSSGSTGTLKINGGTNNFEGIISVARRSSSTGTLTITGGTNTFSSTYMYVGYGVSSTGSLTIGDNEATGKATVYLEAQIGTTTTGDVTITGNAEIIISGGLLDKIVELAESDTGGSVAVICANTITFGDIKIDASTSDLDSIVNEYISAEGYDLTWSYSDNTLWVIAAVAPEPSMFGLFFGLGAIGLVATRRRRRKA